MIEKANEPNGNQPTAGVITRVSYGSRIWIGFALALVALLTVSVAGYRSIKELVTRDDWVDHTHQVIEDLESLQGALKDALTLERAYLLTGVEGYREAALAAENDVYKQVGTVAQSITDNTAEEDNLRALKSLLSEQFSLFRSAVTARRSTGPAAATAMITSGDRHHLITAINDQVDHMVAAERALLRTRNSRAEAAAVTTMRIIVYGSLGVLLFVAFTGIFIARTLLALGARTADLAVSYEQTGKLNQQLAERSAAAEDRAHELAASEDALRSQTSLLRAVVDSMAEGVIAMNGAGRLLLSNPRAARILRVDDLKETFDDYFKYHDVYGGDDDTKRLVLTDTPIYRALRGDPSDNVRLRVHQHDGDMDIWLEVSARPMRDNAGAAFGATIVFRDIGERRREEQERARLAAIIESTDDAVVGRTLDGTITSWNPAAERVYGYTSAEAIGQSIDILRPREVLTELREIDGRLNRGEGFQQYLTKGLRKDGTQIDIEITLSPIRDAAGNLLGVSKISRDVTDARRIQQQLKERSRELERSNGELEQFAYSASHDLQEPLRMVASYVQLLRERYRGRLDSDADDFIDYAFDGATRMKRLINDLLTYSRVGRQMKMQATEMGSALEWALTNLSVAIEEAGAIVTHDEMPVVVGDDAQLCELLQNLIGNALKFHGEAPPRVHIGATRAGDEWVFSVRDNGIGIDAQYFDRIFLMFQRLHNREDYAGTGIGLAICRKIVEQHNGRIWVESQPGQGATFYFSLPATRFVRAAQHSSQMSDQAR